MGGGAVNDFERLVLEHADELIDLSREMGAGYVSVSLMVSDEGEHVIASASDYDGNRIFAFRSSSGDR